MDRLFSTINYYLSDGWFQPLWAVTRQCTDSVHCTYFTHACDDVIVCYNKNPVSHIVSSCYAYFGVVTETGGLSGERKEEEDNSKRIRRNSTSVDTGVT